MNNNQRWTQYLEALNIYFAREGHSRVPASHEETLGDGTTINLGSWVGYVRQRKRAGLLSETRILDIEKVPGWEWGPLRPGPTADTKRNAEIMALRAQGVSLQRIGDEFGLSRQRVHQIVRLLTPAP
jgi:hypothetical protein